MKRLGRNGVKYGILIIMKKTNTRTNTKTNTKTKTETKTKTKTKTRYKLDPICAIFLKRFGRKGVKYDILIIMKKTKTKSKTKAETKTNTKTKTETKYK